MTHEEMTSLEQEIVADLEGIKDVRVTNSVHEYKHEKGERVVRWVSVWYRDYHVAVINSREEWLALYNMFFKVFSTPTQAEVEQMEKEYTKGK